MASSMLCSFALRSESATAASGAARRIDVDPSTSTSSARLKACSVTSCSRRTEPCASFRSASRITSDTPWSSGIGSETEVTGGHLPLETTSEPWLRAAAEPAGPAGADVSLRFSTRESSSSSCAAKSPAGSERKPADAVRPMLSSNAQSSSSRSSPIAIRERFSLGERYSYPE